MASNITNRAGQSNELEWKVIAPLSLTILVIFIHASAFGPLAVNVASDLGTSVALVAQVSTITLATMAVAGLFMGPISDAVGQRRTMLTGLWVLVGSAVVAAIAPNYFIFISSGFVAGLGASMSMGTANGLAVVRYRGDNQRTALSRIQAAGTSGSILGAPILSTIAAVLIWRGAYAVVAVVYLLAIFLIARGVASDIRPERVKISLNAVVSAYRPLAADRSMLALYGGCLFRAISWFGPFVYLGAYYIEHYGLSLNRLASPIWSARAVALLAISLLVVAWARWIFVPFTRSQPPWRDSAGSRSSSYRSRPSPPSSWLRASHSLPELAGSAC